MIRTERSAALRNNSTVEAPKTIPELFRDELGAGGRLTLSDGGEQKSIGWADVEALASKAARQFERSGVKRGITVGLHAAPTLNLVVALLAVWKLGAVVLILPPAMRSVTLTAFRKQLAIVLKNFEVRVLIAEKAWLNELELSGDFETFPIDELAQCVNQLSPLKSESRAEPDDPAIVQLTSGTTSEPKGVLLTHRNIAFQISTLKTVGWRHADDTYLSWLPLYHDLGLIGFFLYPMLTGLNLWLYDPDRFGLAPGEWLDWISRSRATVIGGPNFAYRLIARRLSSASRAIQRWDLSSVRMAINGSEVINQRDVADFLERASYLGFSEKAMCPVYGLAEATMGVTMSELGTGVIIDGSHGNTGANGPNIDGAIRKMGSSVLLGRPIPGVEALIVDSGSGRPLDERGIGELLIKSPSVTPGYFGRPDLDAELFHDGWLRTGDLGYMTKGQFVFAGRKKSLIAFAGRKICAEEIEDIAYAVGFTPGKVAAFGVPDRRYGERVVVLVATPNAAEDLTATLGNRLRDQLGILPTIEVATPSAFQRTSSGKLKRHAIRSMYLGEENNNFT